MIIKYSVGFGLQKRKGDMYSIRMRLSYAGYSRLEFNIGISVKEEEFDKINEKVVGHKNAKRINTEINFFRQNIEELFTRFEVVEKSVPEPEEIRTMLNNLAGKRKEEADNCSNLSMIFDKFRESEGHKNSWSPIIHKRFETLEQDIIESGIKFNLSFLTEASFFKLVEYYQGKKLLNTTIVSKIKRLRQFLRWCTKRGYYDGKLNDFSLKLKGTDFNNEPIFLTWEELVYLFNLKISLKSIEEVRDMFCFCCFTSLRYSDLAKLNWSDVKDGYIHVVTQKTIEGLRIDLNNYSSTILDRYRGIKNKNGLIFPVISNGKMNEKLKDLGVLAKLLTSHRIIYFIGNNRIEEVKQKHELLTTHCGRRTFIVNALYLGIPAEVVMKWTGHEDYKAMKPYIAIVDSLKERSMDLFNKK